MEKYLSKKVKKINPSPIRRFFDLASNVEGVVSLGVGEPDFTTPLAIREKAIEAIHQGKTKYTSNLGMIELRKEISLYQKRRFNLDYNAENEILVTAGASEGIDLAIRALVDEGDEVIIVEPCFVSYKPIISMVGGITKIIEAKEEDAFKLTYDALKNAITTKTKLLFINFPTNPTGGIMTYQDYEKLVGLIKESGILVLSDEIYAELNYEEEHASLAMFEEIKDQIIVMNGYSKAYAMTGWRMGYLCAHKTLIDYMCRIHQYTSMSSCTISQYAAIEATKNGDLSCVEMMQSFKKRRDYIVEGLNRIGLKCAMPKGAFYVFPSVKSTGLTSEEFCVQLVESEKVAVVPGEGFGECGEGFIRISYAYSIEEITEALLRMERFIKNLTI